MEDRIDVKPAIVVFSALLALIAIECWLSPSLALPSFLRAAEASPPKPETMHAATPEKLRERAEQGDPEAQWRLGTLARDGDGVRLSDAEAAKWFERAAEQKFVPALSALGLQYWAGRGVPQDYRKAYFWYYVALAQGDESAEVQLDNIAPELTEEEIAEVHKQAKAWLQAHSSAIESP